MNVTTFDKVFTTSSQPPAELFPAFGVYYSMTPSDVEGNDMNKYDEARIAEEIVNVLPAGVARVCSADRETLRYALRADGLKLRSIVLSRASLRRLIDDPARAVKIEYLQRDLIRSAKTRIEFRYPRLPRAIVTAPAMRKRRLTLPVASLV